MDCIFCKIANKEIESDIIYDDGTVVVFKDNSPQAPVHLLAIPKEHISSANEINADNSHIIGKIYEVIAKIAKEQGFADAGYRIVNNCGEDGGDRKSTRLNSSH